MKTLLNLVARCEERENDVHTVYRYADNDAKEKFFALWNAYTGEGNEEGKFN